MTCILVVGIHRSGTSAVAGVCHTLGVNMGRKLLGKNKYNARGHFEDVEFLQLDKAATGDWRNPTVRFSRVAGKYARLIKSREASNRLWGWKDPRLCYLLPHVVPLIKHEVRLVVVWRRKPAVVKSIHRRRSKANSPINVTRSEAEEVYDRYYAAMVSSLKAVNCERLGVHYETLVKDPGVQVRRIARFVGLPLRKKAVQHINRKLKHF